MNLTAWALVLAVAMFVLRINHFEPTNLTWWSGFWFGMIPALWMALLWRRLAWKGIKFIEEMNRELPRD